MKSDTKGVYTSRLMELEQERTVILTRLKQLGTDQQSGELSRDIAKLHTQLNVVVESTLSLANPEGRDLIDALPPELWGQCVIESLPEYGRVASLIALTLVSHRWRNAILSTPILWADVHVGGYDEDSLATIATSLDLSKSVDLYLTIWIPTSPNWDAAAQLLEPHKHRLKGLSICFVPHIIHHQNIVVIIGALFLKLGLVMALFNGELPNHFSIRIGTSRVAKIRPLPYAKAGQSQNFLAERSWFVTAPISHHLSMLLSDLPSFLRHLTCIQIAMSLSEFLSRVAQPGMPNFPHLELLKLSSSHLVGDLGIRLPAPVPDFFRRLRELECASLSLAQPGIQEVFPVMFCTLRRLHISIPYEEVPRLAGIIQIIPALEILSLRLELRLALIDPRYAPPGFEAQKTITASLFKVSFPILHVSQLGIIFHPVYPILRPDTEEELQDTNLAATQMIQSFLTYLVKVKAAAFTWYSGHTRAFFPTFRVCTNLESLYIRGFKYAAHSAAWINLPNLCELDSYDKIPPISVPNLLNLIIDWTHLPRDIYSMKLGNVRELTIRAKNTKDTISLHPQVYQSLINLRIEALLPGDDFEFTSLASLTRIEILPARPYTTHCTELCAALLFNPGYCPVLQELVLGESPEWDILRLMLEARNFQTSPHVSRIRRITVPHISEEFRTYFSFLLAGRYPADSIPLAELSFEAERQRLYDKSISGCFACVRHSLGPCEEVISPNRFGSWELSPYNLLQLADATKSTADVRAWASMREKFRLEWMKSSNDFQPQVCRQPECQKRMAYPVIEITEHDWMMDASLWRGSLYGVSI